MDKISNDQTQWPHQNIQGKKKDESSDSIGHEDYHPILIAWLKPFSVSLGLKNFILKSIGGSNHFLFPSIHEGWKGQWLEGRIHVTPIG